MPKVHYYDGTIQNTAGGYYTRCGHVFYERNYLTQTWGDVTCKHCKRLLAQDAGPLFPENPARSAPPRLAPHEAANALQRIIDTVPIATRHRSTWWVSSQDVIRQVIETLEYCDRELDQ